MNCWVLNSLGIDQSFWYMWTKQIELVPYDQVKNSFFLVFRKLTYSPNIWWRIVVELSKVKEPSTTDSLLFVINYNVRLSFVFFWRSFVSHYSFKMEESWVRVTHFPVFFATFPLVAHKKHTSFAIRGKKVFLCFSRNFCRAIRNEFYLFLSQLVISFSQWYRSFVFQRLTFNTSCLSPVGK